MTSKGTLEIDVSEFRKFNSKQQMVVLFENVSATRQLQEKILRENSFLKKSVSALWAGVVIFAGIVLKKVFG